jgi:ankyrin repeat protein
MTLLSTWPQPTATEKSLEWYALHSKNNRFIKQLFHFVLQLLKNKADINFVNEHGNTPLHYACFWAYSSIAEDLVNYGAYVSVANKYGEIPLDKCSGVIAKQLHGKSTQDNLIFVELY